MSVELTGAYKPAATSGFPCRRGCSETFRDKTACLRHEWTKHLNCKPEPALVDLTGDDNEMENIGNELLALAQNDSVVSDCAAFKDHTISKTGKGEMGAKEFQMRLSSANRSNVGHDPTRPTFRCKVCSEKLFSEDECMRHLFIKHYIPPPIRTEQTTEDVCETGLTDAGSDPGDSVSIRGKKRKSLPVPDPQSMKHPPQLKNVNPNKPKTVNHTNTKKCKVGAAKVTRTDVNSKETLNIESQKGKYVCQHCGKHLSSQCNLKRHMYTHTNGKNYKCEICNVSFATSGYLRKHNKRKGHQDEKQNSDACDKSSAKPSLENNKRTHTEETYTCTICDKSFTSKSNLNTHTKRHTAPDLICPVCNKSLRDKSWFKVHIKAHNGEKPYSCKFCSKKFASKNKRKNHQETHDSGTESAASASS